MASILIIEDDPLMSRLYEKALLFADNDVRVATDGQAGLDAAREEAPTLILLDIMMPKMNGLEVLEKLKADAATKDIPVVVLTNLAGEQDAEAALSKGAVKYIVKSEHDPKEVVDIITEVLTGYTRDDVPDVT